MNSNFFDLSKRKKRDLLTEFLGGKSPEGIVGKKELNAVNRLIAELPSGNASVKNKKKRAKTKDSPTAVKKPKSKE